MNGRPTWYVLLHRPGPAVPEGERASDQPAFAEHLAFLRRRNADGTLVAAGPLGDAEDEGMTVLAVESAEEAHRLAEEVDACVRQGVLAVTVRPWTVAMAPILATG